MSCIQMIRSLPTEKLVLKREMANQMILSGSLALDPVV